MKEKEDSSDNEELEEENAHVEQVPEAKRKKSAHAIAKEVKVTL